MLCRSIIGIIDGSYDHQLFDCDVYAETCAICDECDVAANSYVRNGGVIDKYRLSVGWSVSQWRWRSGAEHMLHA